MTEIDKLSEARLHQIRVPTALSSTNGPETDTGMLIDLLTELDRIHALHLPQAPPVAAQGFPRPFRLVVDGQQWPGAEWPDGRIALETGEPFGLMALAGTVQELLAMQPEGSQIEWAPEFPLPIRPDGSHWYVSTGCWHGDLVLPDGMTGHEYCRSMTGYQGAKRGGSCKHCGAPCQCPCHREQAAAPSSRWPACLNEADQQLLADQVGASEHGEATVPLPDPQLVCGCVDGGPEELTPEELQDLVYQQGLDLYHARDLIAFVREMCNAVDRDGSTMTTGRVRAWLTYQGCGTGRLPAEAVAALATMIGQSPDTAVSSDDVPDIAGEQR